MIIVQRSTQKYGSRRKYRKYTSGRTKHNLYFFYVFCREQEDGQCGGRAVLEPEESEGLRYLYVSVRPTSHQRKNIRYVVVEVSFIENLRVKVSVYLFEYTGL